MAERRKETCKGRKEALSGGQEGEKRSFTLTESDGYQSGEEKKGKRREGGRGRGGRRWGKRG